jgi:hypothetical protein
MSGNLTAVNTSASASAAFSSLQGTSGIDSTETTSRSCLARHIDFLEKSLKNPKTSLDPQLTIIKKQITSAPHEIQEKDVERLGEIAASQRENPENQFALLELCKNALHARMRSKMQKNLQACIEQFDALFSIIDLHPENLQKITRHLFSACGETVQAGGEEEFVMVDPSEIPGPESIAQNANENTHFIKRALVLWGLLPVSFAMDTGALMVKGTAVQTVEYGVNAIIGANFGPLAALLSVPVVGQLISERLAGHNPISRTSSTVSKLHALAGNLRSSWEQSRRPAETASSGSGDSSSNAIANPNEGSTAPSGTEDENRENLLS